MFGHLVKRCRMPTSTNVWNTHKRCFSYYGIGFLHTVNGMTHWKQYIELLGRRLVPDLYTLFPDWSSIFQYYLPLCHAAKEVNNFFKDNQIKSQQRPENSSDPNHIKKLSMCKQRWRGLHYQGKVDSGLHKSVVQSISSKTAQNWWIQCQIASNHCLRIEQVISCTNWSVLTLFLQKNLLRFLLFFSLHKYAYNLIAGAKYSPGYFSISSMVRLVNQYDMPWSMTTLWGILMWARITCNSLVYVVDLCLVCANDLVYTWFM